MYKILKREKLNKNVYRYKISYPFKRVPFPGQFVIITPNKGGERIPLTLFKSTENDFEVIFKVCGKGTKALKRKLFNVYSVLGPLGKKSISVDFQNAVCVTGGVGVVCGIPWAGQFKNKNITLMCGFKKKSDIFLKSEIESFPLHFLFTEDKTNFNHGNPCLYLEEYLKKNTTDIIFTAGPAKMMMRVCEIAKKYNIKTIASLNPIIYDGTGMCGGCKVSVNKKTVLCCQEGPEFLGSDIDFTSYIYKLEARK